MANICENIICGDMHFFKSNKSELACRTKADTEIIMEPCKDFDVCTDYEGSLHIGAVDEKGNIIYIRYISGHWGRGSAARGANAENIFIAFENNATVIFYTSENKLFSLKIDTGLHEPVFLGELAAASSAFANEGNIYYTNSKGILCKNSKELYEGRGISHIFATKNLVCFKEGDEIKMLDEDEDGPPRSLTRRHGKQAQCPLIMYTENRQTLAWLDGKKMLSSQKEKSWQRLEETGVNDYDIAAIFKLCNINSSEYCIGLMKNNEIVFPHIRSEQVSLNPVVSAEVIKTPSPKSARSEDTLSIQVFRELREIHQKLRELDEKLETPKKTQTVQIIKKYAPEPKKINLYKTHKK